MFVKREVTRLADSQEKADLMQRLLGVLNSIDETREEAKAAAADFRAIIGDLIKREIGLRFNLQTGTITQEIEVKPLINEATGFTEYYTREGDEVQELRHRTDQKEKEAEAAKRQTSLFAEPSELAQKLQDEMQKQFGPDVTVTVGNYQSTVDTFEANAKPLLDQISAKPAINNAQTLLETGTDYVQDYEAKRDELADELGLGKTPDTDTFNPADLDKLSSTMQPDSTTAAADQQQPKTSTVQEATKGQPVKKNGKRPIKA